MVPPDEKPAQWLQTEFVSAEGKDGKSHSFWVERQWRILGTRLTLDPLVSAHWVQFTLKQSYVETGLLTPQQKRQHEAELPNVLRELRSVPSR